MFKTSSVYHKNESLSACACVKNLLMEYDKQGEELDSEKGRANSLERQIDDLTRQLQVSSQQVSSVCKRY